MPFVPDLTLNATWKWSPWGFYLLVLTITDNEDHRETTMYWPDDEHEGLDVCMADCLRTYAVEHQL